MFNSQVWQAARRRSEDGTKTKQVREEENDPVSFSGLTLISSEEGKHRQESSGKRMCESPAFQRKASGIIYCFVTQRCRVNGFSLMVLTFNPFHQYVKNNCHALLLIVNRRQEGACADGLMLTDTVFRLQKLEKRFTLVPG